MKIKINNSLLITTEHNLKEITKLIEDNILEVSKDNIIFWKNVWSVTKSK